MQDQRGDLDLVQPRRGVVADGCVALAVVRVPPAGGYLRCVPGIHCSSHVRRIGQDVWTFPRFRRGGADQNEPTYPRRVGEGEFQRDPPAHGDPEDVGVLVGQGIHQGNRVPGHHLDRVWAVRLVGAAGPAVVEHENLTVPSQLPW